MNEYHYKYFGSRRDAEKYFETQQKRGYKGKVTKKRDDLYEVRTYLEVY